jgi:hypothetical protein
VVPTTRLVSRDGLAIRQMEVALSPSVGGWEKATRGPRGDAVEGEVERQHRHPRLAEEAQLPAGGVLGDEAAHPLLAQAALAGHARDLQVGVGRADVRVQAAGRSRDRVDRHGGIWCEPIVGAISLGQLAQPGEGLVDVGRGRIVLRAVAELRTGGAQVRAAGGGPVIALPGRRGARVEIGRPVEVLADQLGADDDLVADDETPAGLAREEKPGQGGQRDREDHAAQEGQHEDAQQGRAEEGEHRRESLRARPIVVSLAAGRPAVTAARSRVVHGRRSPGSDPRQVESQS